MFGESTAGDSTLSPSIQTRVGLMHWDARMLEQVEKWLQIKLHHADRTPAMVHGDTPVKPISMHLPPYPAGSNPVSTGPTHRHSPLPPIQSGGSTTKALSGGRVRGIQEL